MYLFTAGIEDDLAGLQAVSRWVPQTHIRQIIGHVTYVGDEPRLQHSPGDRCTALVARGGRLLVRGVGKAWRFAAFGGLAPPLGPFLDIPAYPLMNGA